MFGVCGVCVHLHIESHATPYLAILPCAVVVIFAAIMFTVGCVRYEVVHKVLHSGAGGLSFVRSVAWIGTATRNPVGAYSITIKSLPCRPFCLV